MLKPEEVEVILRPLYLAFTVLSGEQRLLYEKGLEHCDPSALKQAVEYLIKNWSEDRAFPRIAEIITEVRRAESDLSYATPEDLDRPRRCGHCGGTGLIIRESRPLVGQLERRAPNSAPLTGGRRRVPWSTEVAHFCQACGKGRAMYEAHRKDRAKKGFVEREPGPAPVKERPEKEPELPYSEVEEEAAYAPLLQEEEDGTESDSGT